MAHYLVKEWVVSSSDPGPVGLSTHWHLNHRLNVVARQQPTLDHPHTNLGIASNNYTAETGKHTDDLYTYICNMLHEFNFTCLWFSKIREMAIRQYLEVLGFIGQRSVSLVPGTLRLGAEVPGLVRRGGGSTLTPSVDVSIDLVGIIAPSCSTQPQRSQHWLNQCAEHAQTDKKRPLPLWMKTHTPWLCLHPCVDHLSFFYFNTENKLNQMVWLSIYLCPCETCLHQVDHFGMKQHWQGARIQSANLWLPEKKYWVCITKD